MQSEYLLRLDDACPTADWGRWQVVEKALNEHGIKPIVAVVPANEDPGLVRCQADDRFWDRARRWVGDGWMIAMHGYSHSLRPSGRGLVPVNRCSEFVGLPEEEQRRRIREGVRELQSRGIDPEAWVAPSHGMDRLTLEALRSETDIRIISDSFTRRPVRRWGFVWIPQQLWSLRAMPGGLWTICLHPNEMGEGDIARLAQFLGGRRCSFADPHDAASRAARYRLSDAAFSASFSTLMKIRRMTTKRKVNE